MKIALLFITVACLLTCCGNHTDERLVHKLWVFERYDKLRSEGCKPVFADNGDKKMISLDRLGLDPIRSFLIR